MDTTACPPPLLTVETLNAPFSDCVLQGEVMVDLGTGWVDHFELEVTGSDGTILYAHEEFGVPGPSVYHWIPLRDDAGNAWPFDTYTVTATASNSQGSSTATTTFMFEDYADVTAPSTLAGFSSPGSAGPVDGWFGGTVRVALSAEDDCEGATVNAWLDGQPLPSHFDVDEEGGHTVTFQATDLHGNEEARREVFVGIDTSAPVLAMVKPAAGQVIVMDQVIHEEHETTLVVGPVTLTADAFDAGVGVADIVWEVDGEVVGHGAELPYTFSAGPHAVTVTAVDGLGHAVSAEPVVLMAV